MNNLTSSNEEIDMIKDVIKDFGVNEITPVVSDIESNSEIPSSILKQVSELGLYGMLGPVNIMVQKLVSLHLYTECWNLRNILLHYLLF